MKEQDQVQIGTGAQPKEDTQVVVESSEDYLVQGGVSPDDPALSFIQKEVKKIRMEDVMERTHWYKKEDLRKIDQMAKIGQSKYQVISTAINSLYQRVMDQKTDLKDLLYLDVKAQDKLIYQSDLA